MTHPTTQTYHDLLPTGLNARPSKHEDAESLADAANAESKLLGLNDVTKPDVFIKDYDDESFDFPDNTLTILDDNNTIVAGALLYMDKGAEEIGYIWYVMRPESRNTGLEDVIVAWYEQRLHTNAFPTVDAELKIALHAWANVANAYRVEQYTRLGFQEIRRFYRMRIDLTQEPVAKPLPEGYRYIPYQHPEGISDIVRVMNTAFKDHWGHIDLPLEQEIDETLSWFKKEDSFDPSLFLSVQHEETGELIATCWVFLELSSETDKALVADVGVLREHRGKGIAEAMLTQSFYNFYQRGKNIVVLNVDTHNPSGALRLYTKAGMSPEREFLRLEKILRSGIDRSTQETANA